MTDHVFDGDRRIFRGDVAVIGKTHRRHRTGINHATHAALLRRPNNGACAFHVGAVHLLRITDPEAVIGGYVKNKITSGHCLLERFRITQIAFRRFRRQAGDVVEFAGLAHQQAQLGALRGQGSRHMAADKSRRSCDEGFHGFVLFIPSAARDPYLREWLRTHSTNSVSSRSPEANANIARVASVSSASSTYPFLERNKPIARNAVLLFPSKKGWLRAIPNPYA